MQRPTKWTCQKLSLIRCHWKTLGVGWGQQHNRRKQIARGRRQQLDPMICFLLMICVQLYQLKYIIVYPNYSWWNLFVLFQALFFCWQATCIGLIYTYWWTCVFCGRFDPIHKDSGCVQMVYPCISPKWQTNEYLGVPYFPTSQTNPFLRKKHEKSNRPTKHIVPVGTIFGSMKGVVYDNSIWNQSW